MPNSVPGGTQFFQSPEPMVSTVNYFSPFARASAVPGHTLLPAAVYQMVQILSVTG